MTGSADDLLSRKHMVRTILMLRSRGTITQSDINEYVSNWNIVRDRAQALRESGMAEEQLVREGKMVMRYRVTPKGRFIGNLLEIVDRTVRDEFDFEGTSLESELEAVCRSSMSARTDKFKNNHRIWGSDSLVV